MSREKHSQEKFITIARELADQLGRRPSMTEFVAHVGISNSTISKYCGTWTSLARDAFDTDPNLSHQAVQTHRLRERAREARGELKAVVKDLEKKNSSLQEANDFLLGIADLTESLTSQPIVAKKRKKGGPPEAAYVMLGSDWHMGERVRPEQIGHLNEYNPDIAEERAEQFFKSNLTMLNANRAAWDIDQVVFWLGGDFMTGWIHEEYEADNFLSPTEETLLVFKTLVRGIDFLLAESDARMITIPTNNGNHGRTGRKKRIGDDFRNSYEHMMYELLIMHYKGEPRVKFQLGIGYHNVLDIYGFKVRFSHGDAVRSGGGVGGIAPSLYRRLGKLAQGGGDTIGLDCMGHLHQLDFLRKFVRNGSLIGWNAFADWLGCEPEPAQQASFVIDSKHQIACAFNPIIVIK